MSQLRALFVAVLGTLILSLGLAGPAPAQDTGGMPGSASSTQGMPPMPMHPPGTAMPMHSPGTGQTMPMQPPGNGSMPMSHRYRGAHVLGRHTMSGTVTAADASTGIVEVDVAGMALRVHFPPPAMKDLKPGDKITLHMAFSRP